MIVVNQKGNKSITIEKDIAKTVIEHDYNEEDLSTLEILSLRYRMLWQYNSLYREPYEFRYKKKNEYKKALEKYNIEKKERDIENAKEEKEIDKQREEIYTHKQYYKIKIDDVLYAMYEKKDVAYKVYADMFIVYGNDDKVYNMPKEEETK